MKISGAKFDAAFKKSELTLQFVGNAGRISPQRVFQIRTSEEANVNALILEMMCKTMNCKVEDLI